MTEQEILEHYRRQQMTWAEGTIRCPCGCHARGERVKCRACGFATMWSAR